MGKRSNYPRADRDFYPTPESAVRPLIPYLVPNTMFVEPCAGDGALARHLVEAGLVCVSLSDIEPRGAGILRFDALEILPGGYADYIITNPPWRRDILHPMITRFSDRLPTWLLFDADWMHTQQSAPFLPRLAAIVSIGRVKWIAGSRNTGKDNCAWYLFDRDHRGPTRFYGRAA